MRSLDVKLKLNYMSNIDSKSILQRDFIKGEVSRLYNPVRVEVIFGAPGKQCQGAGICRVLPVEHVRVHWKCPSARAWLGSMEDGSVSLTFDRSLLSPYLLERYFGEQIFKVEEDYAIPNTLLTMLNIGSFTVKAGQYSIKVSELFFVICF